VVASGDGRSIYVACATAGSVLVFDAEATNVAATIPVPASPTGLALSQDGTRLFVTCSAPESLVCVVDTAKRKIVRKLAAGHSAQS
jgi:YVTN family beta-propeller protein